MKSFCLKVWGDFACFTRPEMKVERMSYDVITPSSARSIFEAILWKPEIRWEITRIEVLNPVRWMSVRRNEVSEVISTSNVLKAIKGNKTTLAQYVEDDRQQRAALVLRDVAYLLHGQFHLTDPDSSSNITQKYSEMFRRRAIKGQCFNQPYLGCREFASAFELIEDRRMCPAAIDETRDLGWMLYDLDYSRKDDIRPLFFRANLQNGVIVVPPLGSAEVKG